MQIGPLLVDESHPHTVVENNNAVNGDSNMQNKAKCFGGRIEQGFLNMQTKRQFVLLQK